MVQQTKSRSRTRLELERRESWLLILHIVCHSVGVYFIPLVFETLGGWNDDAVKNWLAFEFSLPLSLSHSIVCVATVISLFIILDHKNNNNNKNQRDISVMGPQPLHFLRELGRRVGRHTGDPLASSCLAVPPPVKCHPERKHCFHYGRS